MGFFSHAFGQIAKAGTSITKASNEAFTVHNYMSTKSFTHMLATNPLALGVAMTATGGLVDPSWGAAATTSKQTQDVARYARDHVPALKNLVNYYQDHVGNYLQKVINHVSDQIHCNPETGALVTGSVATVAGAVASVYTTPAGGAAVATGVGMAGKALFKAGYKSCHGDNNDNSPLPDGLENAIANKKTGIGWLPIAIAIGAGVVL